MTGLEWVLLGLVVVLFVVCVFLEQNQRDLARLLAKKADVKWVSRGTDVLIEMHNESETALEERMGRRLGEVEVTVVRAAEDAQVARVNTMDLSAKLIRLEETKTPRAKSQMDDQEKILMRQNWDALLCQHCGWAHPGVCPRIKETRTESMTGANGKVLQVVTVVEFWPNDQWEPPEGAVHPSDVWDTPVAAPTAIAAAAGEAAGN